MDKTTIRRRPENTPWGGDLVWEHRCHRPECERKRELSAWTWHHSWHSALGRAWRHISHYHSG